jgi:hypothetical protein
MQAIDMLRSRKVHLNLHHQGQLAASAIYANDRMTSVWRPMARCYMRGAAAMEVKR